MFKIFLVAMVLGFSSCQSVGKNDNSSERAARQVLKRTIGEKAENIKFESIAQVDGRDVYEYSAKNGKLSIKGSSSVAITRGMYDYLRKNNLGMVGWEGARVKIPSTWSDCENVRVVTPFKIRHCYNVVTAGYTTAYWTWERWEQELDWLAMHGFNMIMAPVATEAIATRVWKKIGLTQKEIDNFYVGPAHLPWQRMGNIQRVAGTLPQDWHRDQVALQKKILKRMRELSIEPVVQSFAGFVPVDIKRIFPNIKLHNTLWNGGFGKEKRPVVMMPDNPLFAKISKMYMTEWKREFGIAKYYLVDSFNEMHLPKTDKPVTELLADYGKHTFKAIKAGNPDGIWVIQGWMFNYQRYIWNKDTVKALLSSVPNDRMFILDYANDYKSNWDDFNGFHGKPWAMGYVPNSGGKTAYTGKMHFYAAEVNRMLNHKLKNNNIGFTISSEGLENNQVLYELMSDTAWDAKAINLDKWVKMYCQNRYGSYPEGVKKAWDLYRKTCYGTFTPHPRFGWQTMNCRHGSVNRDPRFTEGVLSFLSCKDKLKKSASYSDDALEMAAISLSLKADEWFVLAQKSFNAGNVQLMETASKRGLEILLEVDRLLESHSLNRLDRWIKLARQHSSDSALNDFYEHNARRIVTVWGPPVNDYSARMWSGLIRDYYQPRMAKYFSAIKSGTGFNRSQWDEKWVTSTGISTIDKYQNPVAMAEKLVKKAYDEKLPKIPKLNEGELLGEWMPVQMSTKWKTLEWNLDLKQLKTFKGVRFIYKKGSHRLAIKSVSLIADGNKIAEEVHHGLAGTAHIGNTYLLKLPKNINANNGCLIRAVIRSDGGTNSQGVIQIIK